jgi:DNA gyrase inhibitor GyrI/DNA-binding transcriptional ArsR family regulator
MAMQPNKESFDSKNELQRFMKKSFDGILELLKTLDHPKRMEMMISMIGGDTTTFKELLEITELQKSAMAHHLSVLVDRGMIEKKQKGVYQITIDGEDLLERIAESYIEAKIREQKRLDRLLYSIGKSSIRIDEGYYMKVNEMKIVKLPKMRVVSFHVKESKTPEEEAFSLLKAWAEPQGLFKNPAQHQVYGFNNPDPTKEKPTYGYEFWITVGEDFTVDESQSVKSLEGGLFAVMTCKGVENISTTWGELVKRIEDSEYNPTKTHQWLEHHLTPTVSDHNELLLELYAPISE